MAVRALAYVDGGCAGNDQRDLAQRRMVAVVTNKLGRVVFEGERAGGSNNIAELWAVLEAVKVARQVGTTHLEVRTDSRNNLAWVFGSSLGKHLNDRQTVEGLRAEIAKCRRVVTLKLVWVPREQNLAGHYIERRYQL